MVVNVQIFVAIYYSLSDKYLDLTIFILPQVFFACVAGKLGMLRYFQVNWNTAKAYEARFKISHEALSKISHRRLYQTLDGDSTQSKEGQFQLFLYLSFPMWTPVWFPDQT